MQRRGGESGGRENLRSAIETKADLMNRNALNRRDEFPNSFWGGGETLRREKRIMRKGNHADVFANGVRGGERRISVCRKRP